MTTPDDFVNFDKPQSETLNKAMSLLRAYFSPVSYGLENIEPGIPYLFAGNHTTLGFFDTFMLYDELRRSKDIYLRGMADHAHFSMPYWGDFIKRAGAVPGTRENCRKVMEAGQSICVFPGGGREVAKRRGESYQLFWKKRTGFVRMAVEQGYSILPFAAVGGESIFSIVRDADEIMASPLGKMLKRRGLFDGPTFKNGEQLPPLVRGIGLSMFPRPERLYFSFGKPVSTKRYQGKHEDEKTLLKLRAEVEDSVSSQIGELLILRERDTDSGILRKILNRL